jgi:hypothetical protein
VIKIRSFENLFISFLNFFQGSRWGWDHSVDPTPPHLLYPGTNSTSEVPVLRKFTYTPVWTILDFGQKLNIYNKFSERLIFFFKKTGVSPTDWLQSALKIRRCAKFFIKL